MKQFAILLATLCMVGFAAEKSFAQGHHGGHYGGNYGGHYGGYYGGNHGYYGNRTAFSISIGNGYNGFSYGQGYGGYGYGVRHYRPVYRRAYGYGGHGGGVNLSYGNGGCGGW